MEILGEKIVLNDNYSGLLFLTKELELVNKLTLIEDLIIYSSFKKTNEILLFCPENGCLIYVDIVVYNYKIIPLTGFDNIMFSMLYFWDNIDIFLSDYQGNLIKVNLEDSSLSILGSNSIECKRIQEIYIKLKGFNIIKVFLSERKVLVRNTESKLILLGYSGEMDILNDIEFDEFHDFELMNDNFALVGENRVSIFNKESTEIYYPSDFYSYLRGKFMLEDGKVFLLLLSANKQSSNNVKIEKYKLQ